jgi:hypothetical protein
MSTRILAGLALIGLLGVSSPEARAKGLFQATLNAVSRDMSAWPTARFMR